MTSQHRIVLIVHNVRSAANVGSLLRTADGAGVTQVWLSGYTPAPARLHQRFLSRAEKALAKTALGAEYSVAWKKSPSLSRTLKELRADGYRIVALEQSDSSLPLSEFSSDRSVAFVVGNEVRGIDARILRQCDGIVEIPMYGAKNSLNVAVAGGIALYTIRATIEERK